MIARVIGVAIDARALPRRDAGERREAARWIAGNLLAARGVRALQPAEVTSFDELVAAIATAPELRRARELPLRWRVALRLVGMPL